MGDRAIVGREDEVAAVLRALADPACDGVFLVASEPGAGATAVLDAVLGRLAAAGRPHNRIVASRGAGRTPFGALAHLLPGIGAAASDAEHSDLFERIRTRIAGRGAGPGRFVTAVDDVRWLDEQSLGLLSTLLAGKLAVVLAALRAGDPVPAPVAAVERSCTIRRVPIGPLAAADIAHMVARELDGPVDGVLVDELLSLSRGNPLFLLEVLAGATASGTITRSEGLWQRTGPLLPTTRLASVFDPDLEGLGDEQRRALDLLAVCGPLNLHALERLGLGAAVVDLDRRGLVASARHGAAVRVHVMQPLLAAVTSGRLSPLRRRALLRDAIGALGQDPARADRVRLMEWCLEAGIQPTAADLLAAVREADAADDAVAVERLTAAIRVPELDPRDQREVLLTRAAALTTVGRFGEAAAMLDAAVALPADDPARATASVLRHRIALWSGADAADSASSLEHVLSALDDPESRDRVIAARIGLEAVAGRPSACDGLAGDLDVASPRLAAAVSAALTTADVRLGRLARAAGRARAVAASARGGAADASLWRLDDAAAVMLRLAEGTALGELGRFDDAEVALEAAYRGAVARRMAHAHAWAAGARARVELLRMRPDAAARRFVENGAVSARIAFQPGRRSALTGLVVCASLAGDHEEVRRLGALLDALPGPPTPWPHGALADAGRRVADGDPAAAVAGLVDVAVAAAERGELLLAADCSVEAVRLGATELPPVLPAVLGQVDGELAAARAAFVRGAIERDGAVLEAAERRFVALDIPFAAAESAALASAAARRAGSSRRAAAAATRASHHLARSGVPPSLLVRRVPPAQELTPREAQIAALAASGTASKDIAARLGLSVRTVSNHLQHAYAKLGVSARDDLGAALAAIGPD